MAQITIYLADDLEAQARKTAEAQGTSLGRWIADQVTEKVSHTWPPEVLAALGSFADFPKPASLREGYRKDAGRESLVEAL
jgi:hypothetical protein